MPWECGSIALFLTLTCEPSLLDGVFYVTFEPPEVVPCLSAFASVRWLPQVFRKPFVTSYLAPLVLLNLGPENLYHC